MFALVSPDKIQLPAGTVMRMLGSWKNYQELSQCRGDSSIPRIKYSNGEILLMSPLPKHGRDAHILANIVEALLDAQNRRYEAFTPITMELAEIGGIEPDYCFYIDNFAAAVGRDRLDWENDPPPDLVIEIDVTTYTKVADYLPFRVPEVWLFKRNQLTIHRLQGNEYQLQTNSSYFPAIDLQTLIDQCLKVANEWDTGTAIRELRQTLSQSS
jgi:Uma2 family endonuclease